MSPRCVRIAPSLLAAPGRWDTILDGTLYAAGVRLLHVDVMDGRYVKATSFDISEFEDLAASTPCIDLDVHLMCRSPEDVALEYVESGARYVSFHADASRDPQRLLKQLRRHGSRAGLALLNAEPVETLRPMFPFLDRVIVMGVVPGAAGQAMLPGTMERVRAVREMLDVDGSCAELVLDGGVTADNACEAVRAGATTLVAGKAIFGTPDILDNIRELERRVTQC